MPRLVAKVPSYRKHRQSGQAIVAVYGRDHLLGPHGSQTSRDKYDRLIAEWLAQGRHPEVSLSTGGVTIVELCSQYSEYAASYYQEDGKLR